MHKVIKRTLAIFLVASLLAMAILGVLLQTGFFEAPTDMDANVEALDYETVICGAIVAPGAVMGIPASLEVNIAGIAIITFKDGYTLSSGTIPSFYLNRTGVFVLEKGKVTRYALVNDPKWHPCPETTATPTP